MDYYDRPRKGIANYRGQPHLYECIFDEEKDDYSELFQLTPLPNDIFRLDGRLDHLATVGNCLPCWTDRPQYASGVAARRQQTRRTETDPGELSRHRPCEGHF